MKDALKDYLDTKISVYTRDFDGYSEGILREVTEAVLILETKGHNCVENVIIPLGQVVKIVAIANPKTKI